MIHRALSYSFLLVLFMAASAYGQKKSLQMTIDHAMFKRGDKALLEIYMNVQSNSLEYLASKEGHTSAAAEVTLKILDEEGAVVADKFNIKSPDVPDSLGFTLDLVTQQSYNVPFGKYTLQISAKDANVPDQEAVSADLPINLTFPDTTLATSDIELVYYFVKASENDVSRDGRKYGYDMAGRTSSFFGPAEERMKFYMELYNADSLLGKDEPFLVNFRILKDGSFVPLDKFSFSDKYKANPVVSIYKEMDISALPSGNYYLVADVRDRQNEPVGSNSKFFQRSNPSVDDAANDIANFNTLNVENTFAAKIPEEGLDNYMRYLRPIASQSEKYTIEGLLSGEDNDAKRRYYYAFWKKRSKVSPDKLFKEYERRMKTADENYGSKNFKAYEQHRGRVFMQYGPPNRIETEMNDPRRRATEFGKNLPYEIWYYYSTDSYATEVRQGNTIFVFLQDNLGNNNYRLVHSTALGEVYYPNWKEAAQNQQLRGAPTSTDYLMPQNQTGF